MSSHRAADWRPHIAAALAQAWSLPEGARWIEAQVHAESAGDPEARSSAGAVGLLQLEPVTAREMGLRVDDLVDERRDPVKNLGAGVRYLKTQYDQLAEIPGFNDRLFWSLAAYNAGRGFINVALWLARRDKLNDWWRWEVGQFYLFHHELLVAGIREKILPASVEKSFDPGFYRETWSYIRRIQAYHDGKVLA